MGVLRANVGGTWVDVGQGTDVRVWNGAWGIVAQAVITANQTGIGATDTVLTGSGLVVSTIAGRRYRFSVNMSPYANTANTSTWIKLRRDGTLVGGRTTQQSADLNASNEAHVEYTYAETVTGSRTFDVALISYGASGGTVGNSANATMPTFVTVEDMGPTLVTVLPPQVPVANPGNALGIIAVGAPANRGGVAITATAENIGPPINVYTQIGRRYRFRVNGIRAATANPTGYVCLSFYGPTISKTDWYVLASTAYDSLNAEVVFNGTGSVGTYSAQINAQNNSGTAVWTEPAYCGYYIEDCGPNTPVGVADVVVPTAVPWQPLAYATGWANYGSGFELGQYRKVGDEVQLRGLINCGTGAGATIATLPVGYRPSAIVLGQVGSNPAPTPANTRIDIFPDGNINYNGFAVGQWLSLSGTTSFSVTA